MGNLFSRTRSPATELERIALEIGDLRQRLEKITNRRSTALYYYYMIIFIIVTIAIAHSWLRYDHPKRTYVVSGLAIGAFLIMFVGRYIISSFFLWRTNSTTQKLDHAISQKGVLLDLVKETLKFKEAKEILDRYEKEEQSNERNVNRSAPASPIVGKTTIKDKAELNKTIGGIQGTPKRNQKDLSSTRPEQQPPTIRPASSASSVGMTPYYQRNPNSGPMRPYLRQTGAVDRLLDYFMSDGPSCRNALICSICHTHNGMALPAEYPYISFRCFECGHMNPAKKTGQQFPIARLPPAPNSIVKPKVVVDSKTVVNDDEKDKKDSDNERTNKE